MSINRSTALSGQGKFCLTYSTCGHGCLLWHAEIQIAHAAYASDANITLAAVGSINNGY